MTSVSVIIPAHNAAAYLAQCLQSIVSQGVDNTEIIIINDASTDGTDKICREWEHRYPFIKTLQANHIGPSAARNLGIAEAKGEYIIFCDADDTYYPGAFRTLFDIINADSECDMVIGQMSETETTRHTHNNLKKTLSGAEALRATLYQKKYFHNSPCAKIYRRRIFNNIQLFRDGMRFEDLEIVPRLYLNARRITVCSEPVYYYRPHEQSFMHTWSDSRFDAISATRFILEYVGEHYPEALKAARSRRFSTNYYILRLFKLHKNREIAEQCIQQLHDEALSILFDTHTRFKNKLGAAAALLGKSFLRYIGKL
ncbi:MAG: glycosyltransferase [Muribaculaceae bacterium]|nr:glycosyltransferase [Muribaculaceae bacterium]